MMIGASGGVAPPFALLSLNPRGKNHRYPFDMRLDGPLNLSGRCREEEKNLALLGIEPEPCSPLPVKRHLTVLIVFQ
jgi:hypothetical protein